MTLLDVERTLEKGKQLMLDRYEPATQLCQQYMLDRFLSYEQTVQYHRPGTSLTEMVTGFLSHVREQHHPDGQMIKFNTLSNYLWLLQTALPVYDGRQIPQMALETIRRSLLKKHTPTVKANPLPFWQLLRLLEVKTLSTAQKALAVALWLSTQRGSTILDILAAEINITSEIALGDPEDVVTIFFLAKRKNKRLVERLDPICQQWTLGRLAPWLLKHLHECNSLQLWNQTDASALEKAIRRLPVQQRHTLLKTEYTLYSIKRGALQQLGHLEPDWQKIQMLSLHAQLDSLAVYIGAFLNPRVRASKDMTALLCRPPATLVPHELQPMPRQQRQTQQPTRTRRNAPPQAIPPPIRDDQMLNLDFLDDPRHDIPRELQSPIAIGARHFTQNHRSQK